LWPIEEVQVILESGNLDPHCDMCDGFVKPATISFGQPMPKKATIDAYECASRCDLFLMAGSSLQVEPAASMPREAHRAGAKLIFINRTKTPYDQLASLIFREDAGEVLGDILQRLEG